MGEFIMSSLHFDEIARQDGDAVAQKLWEIQGGSGTYVPGYVAVPQWSDFNGSLVGYQEWKAATKQLEAARQYVLAEIPVLIPITETIHTLSPQTLAEAHEAAE